MENIEFEMDLKCTAGPDGYPGVKIGLAQRFLHTKFRETIYWQGIVEEERTVKFTGEVAEGHFELFIDFEGNDNDKLIVDESTGLPTNVGQLSIESLKVEDIDCHMLSIMKSTYYVDQSEIWVENKQQKQCTTFGNKGVWRLAMTCPVYVWLLENL